MSFAQEFSSDALLHEKPGSGAADLALIEPDRIDDTFNGSIEISIFMNDEGRLAAQFQRKLLARTGGGLADEPADFGRTGEGDLVDIGMINECRTRLAVACDDVDDARRQACLAADFGEGQGRERREFGGLQDHGVTGGEGGCDLPGQHEQREIPRNDLPAHADRLIAGKFVGDHLGPAGVMIEMAGDERNIDITGLTDRLAIVHRLEHRKEALALLDQSGNRVEMRRAAMARQLRPWTKGFARRFHCSIDIGRRYLSDARASLDPVAGFTHIKILAILRRNEIAVDKMTKAILIRFQPVRDVTIRFRSRTIVHGIENLFDARHCFSFLRRARDG